MAANVRPQGDWNLRILIGVALSAFGAVATHDAWLDIADIAAQDEESSHIFLVPIIAAWLYWVRRGRWRQCRATGTLIGPLLIVVGWLLYSCGDIYGIQSFWHGGAVVVLIGCMISTLGKDILLRYLPVIIVLSFLIPVPGLVRQRIALPLQGATAAVTRHLLEIFGADIGHTGNVLTINGIDVAVAEACNGLRMVFALTLVSFAFAFGTPLRPYVRALVVLISPASAILCNVIRLIPTVWLYGYYPTNVANAFHNASGWIMLPISFLGLMAVIHLLRWALVPVTPYVLAYD